MNVFELITLNAPLGCACLCWLMAQILKVLITLVTERRYDIGRLLAPGGMPSSHAAFVTGLAVTMGVQQGFGSPYFAICAALALVVMYDACGVRRAVGEQAKVINRIIARQKAKDGHFEENLKEILGHTPLQVAAGFILGVIIAIIFVSINR
ncbi:MAG: divergent PAP2 family protein [Clostridia bacterium]|nr:divergent PAP2 family protein [Clostridia bacterium]